MKSLHIQNIEFKLNNEGNEKSIYIICYSNQTLINAKETLQIITLGQRIVKLDCIWTNILGHIIILQIGIMIGVQTKEKYNQCNLIHFA